jgi:hypothetical protein
MARPATLAFAALIGLLLAGCSGKNFGQNEASLPTPGEGVQTVSDVADALDTHRSSASESAKTAIAATDAVGSVLREISDAERILSRSARNEPRKVVRRLVLSGPAITTLRTFSELSSRGNRRVISGSDFVMQPTVGNVTQFCESSAGFSVTGIPSLDVTFGWESGAFSGGARSAEGHGLALWSANASGEIVQAPIGGLAVKRGAGSISCPMTAPAFALSGPAVSDAFSIPISLAFRHGELSGISVANAKFANGESLDMTTGRNRQPLERQPFEVNGVLRDGRAQVATFQANAAGDGTLTVTSTGAQYVIADWIVVGT